MAQGTAPQSTQSESLRPAGSSPSQSESKPRRKVVISARNITKTFATAHGGTQVLKGVDLDIYDNELLMIFGPSGCGKSTFLNVLMGLEQPTTGSVSLYGINLWDLEEDDRALIRKKYIGVMYQQQYWIQSLDVEENVAFPSLLLGDERGKAREKAETWLSQVGMNHRMSFIPKELSSGEQQKVSLARALIGDPKLIIADEPTGNLDTTSGVELMEMLKKFKEMGKTIIMVTHNPEHLEYADRILFMLDGKMRKDIRAETADLTQVKREMTENLERFIEAEGAGSVKFMPDPQFDKKKKKEIKKTEEEWVVEKDRLSFVKGIFGAMLDFLKYDVYLFAYLLFKLISLALSPLKERLGFVSRLETMLEKLLYRLSKFFNTQGPHKITQSIDRQYIVDLSFQNLLIKKSRTVITVFAMGIGIGFIVFLLSVGYGLEELVISRIATIEEMKQVEVMPTVSSNLYITDEVIAKIKDIDGVDHTYPVISTAAKIEFEDSLTDVVSYGVQTDYLNVSTMNLIAGEFYDNNELTLKEDHEEFERKVVINEQLTITLGIDADDAIGKTMEISHVYMKQDDEENPRFESENIAYRVVGVVSDENPPVIYTPIVDVKNLGIDTYSQILLVLKNTDNGNFTEVRRKIEAMGFETQSVLDTIAQVDTIFRYVKIVLMVIGMVALSVAVLGMFNTLTISLLERTHEVGLMKTLGMKSNEIRHLFISESMLMSIIGGSMGVIIGILEGYAASLFLSVISVSKGEGMISISTTPLKIILGILLVSTVVGFLTGLYPSRRAVKMSALDALRYE